MTLRNQTKLVVWGKGIGVFCLGISADFPPPTDELNDSVPHKSRLQVTPKRAIIISKFDFYNA